MESDHHVKGKRILIVDDEQDVLESLCDLLNDCKIDMAHSYAEAVEMIEKNYYDLAILDIMGVDGYGLLEKTKESNIPAIMLTAHGLSVDNLVKSVEKGALYYAPKEELVNIKEIVADVFDALENNKSTWERMYNRLGGYYDRRFNGTEWRKKYLKYVNQRSIF